MKVLVVQGYNMDEYPIPKTSFNQFWGPCMDSVKKWTAEMGYDYKFYTGPIENIDYPSLLNTPCSYDRTKGQFYKFQWCDHPEYDQVIWVDADVYVWGLPNPIKEHHYFRAGSKYDWKRFLSPDKYFRPGDVNVPVSIHEEPAQEIFDISASEWAPMPWRRLHLAVYWGSGQAMNELNTWAKECAYNKDARGDIVNGTAIWARTEGFDYTEEQYLAQWVHDNNDKVTWYPVADSDDFPQTQKFFYNFTKAMPTQKDCFLHFGGSDKYVNYQRFLCWRAWNRWTE